MAHTDTGEAEPTDWEDILWREWRNTPDETWARALYAELAVPRPRERWRRRLARASVSPAATTASALWMAMCGFGGGIALSEAICRYLGLVFTPGCGIASGLLGAVGLSLLSRRAYRKAVESAVARRRGTWGELLRAARPHTGTSHWAGLTWFRAMWAAPIRVRLADGRWADMLASERRRLLPMWLRPPTSRDVRSALGHAQLPESLRGLALPLEDTGLQGLAADVGRSEDRRYPLRRERTLLALAEIGGEAIAAVQDAARERRLMRGAADRALRRIAHQTLADVGEATEELVCSECYTRYAHYDVPLSAGRPVRAVGCRACRHSRGGLRHPGPIVAVLDGRDDRESWNQDEELRVNWLALARRSGFGEPVVFDLDRVEVLSATDEELEHFLVGVTNDTDRARRKSYRRMEVAIAPGCSLSPNTLTLLEEAFGRVN